MCHLQGAGKHAQQEDTPRGGKWEASHQLCVVNVHTGLQGEQAGQHKCCIAHV